MLAFWLCYILLNIPNGAAKDLRAHISYNVNYIKNKIIIINLKPLSPT